MALISCKECGVTVSNKAKSCPNCGAPIHKTSKTVWIALFCILGFIFIIIPMINGYNEAAERAKQKSNPESKSDYIATCNTYNYEDIARTPDNYVNCRAKFCCKIVQVTESANRIILRGNILKDDGSTSEDYIYIEHTRVDDEPRILENDIVNIYGDLNGIKTYETVLHTENSIPFVKARYIDNK